MAQKKVLVLNTDNEQVNVSTDESVLLLRKIVQLLQVGATSDIRQRQKITIDALGNTGGTPTEVGANIPVSLSSSFPQNVTVQFGPQATIASAGLDSRFLLMDTSRNAYANGIRSKLSWS